MLVAKIGAEQNAFHELRPEKAQAHSDGRGFNSPHLHPWLLSRVVGVGRRGDNRRMTDTQILDWMLDTDPSLRWQVERDLVGAPPAVWQATRARVAREGFGARLLALQDADGQWAGGAYFPADFDFQGPEAVPGAGQPWTATTWSLNALREWGVDASALMGTAELLAANSRWEYENLPYWGGEVDCCINAWTMVNGVAAA